MSEAAVLQEWRCPRDRLWRIPLTSTIRNINTDTLLLDSPDGRNSLNALYKVPPVSAMLGHIDALRDRPPPTHAINHVYELPSVEPAIRYLHGAAGFPTKSTWLKAIRKGNFLSWPLINVKNVNKYFPESEETQRGHMRNQPQGVRSTQPVPPRTTPPRTVKLRPLNLKKVISLLKSTMSNKRYIRIRQANFPRYPVAGTSIKCVYMR